MNALLHKHDLHHDVTNSTFHEQEGGFGSKPLSDVVNMVKKFFIDLQPKKIRALYEYYHNDFAAFNYTFDFETLEAGGF